MSGKKGPCHTRRDLIAAGSAAAIAGLAGCTGSSDDGGAPSPSTDDDDQDTDDEPVETEYTLQLEGDTEIDLTPLEGYSPEDLPETDEDLIEQGFYAEITPVLYKEKGDQTEKYEGQEEIEEELEQELTLIIDGQEQEYTNIILENQLENDQYQLEITPKIGDESTRIELGLTDQTTGITIEKKSTEHHTTSTVLRRRTTPRTKPRTVPSTRNQPRTRQSRYRRRTLPTTPTTTHRKRCLATNIRTNTRKRQSRVQRTIHTRTTSKNRIQPRRRPLDNKRIRKTRTRRPKRHNKRRRSSIPPTLQ